MTTLYMRDVPARDWGVVCGRTSLTESVFGTAPAAGLSVEGFSRLFSAPAPPAGRTSGVPPPRVSPARCEHTGQAPGPCASSTFSATAICWSLVARSARGAYRVPPKASQVDWVNCSPP